jgi:hypothetical protein
MAVTTEMYDFSANNDDREPQSLTTRDENLDNDMPVLIDDDDNDYSMYGEPIVAQNDITAYYNVIIGANFSQNTTGNAGRPYGRLANSRIVDEPIVAQSDIASDANILCGRIATPRTTGDSNVYHSSVESPLTTIDNDRFASRLARDISTLCGADTAPTTPLTTDKSSEYTDEQNTLFNRLSSIQLRIEHLEDNDVHAQNLYDEQRSLRSRLLSLLTNRHSE